VCFGNNFPENFKGCHIQASVGYFEANLWQFWKNKEGETAII